MTMMQKWNSSKLIQDEKLAKKYTYKCILRLNDVMCKKCFKQNKKLVSKRISTTFIVNKWVQWTM